MSLAQSDKNLFNDLFVDPVVEENTPDSNYWPRQLKLYQVYDKEKEKNIHPQGYYSLYSQWIIAPDGTRFKASKISLALKKIDYFPASEAEAAYIAAILARFGFNAGILGEELLGDDVFSNKIPEKTLRQISLPRTAKTEQGYKVYFYAHTKANSGNPEEWIKYYKARIEPGIFEVTELKTVWNEKGKYRW